MINRRGVSAVVATVLLILITIAAAALVSQFVVPFVKNSLQSGGECVPYRDYFKFQESFSYKGQDYHYNCELNGDYGAIIKSSSGKDSTNIKGFAILFSNDEDSKKVTVLSGDVAGDVKMLALPDAIIIPSPGETRTYVFNLNKENLKKMEIYPVLKNGRLCDKSDEISINKCDGAVFS